jgi:hypothetical protein
MGIGITNALQLGLLAAALAGTGCTRVLMTPPSRTADFETPQVLARGEKSVTISGGVNEGIFYTGVIGGSVQGRMGLGDGREAGLDVSVLKVADRGSAIKDPARPWIYSVNGRIKANPAGAERWCSLFGGLGVGHSDPATFATLDGGFSLGWENRRLVPYFGAKGTLDVPLLSRAVDLNEPDDERELDDYVQKPPVTLGGMAFAGLKLPISGARNPASAVPALLAEAQYSHFLAGGESIGFVGGRAALQFPVRL